MFRFMAVVVGSYVLSVVLVLCTDPLLSRVFPGDFLRGHIPSNNALMASTACFGVISIFCAWFCARLAPDRSGRAVRTLFLLGEVVGAAATVANWKNGWPHWYGISWLIVWPICCWIGLMLAPQRKSAQAAA